MVMIYVTLYVFIIIRILMILYRTLTLVKNDNSKHATYITYAHVHMEQGMYTYVQKAEGESAGESKGLLLKEVSFQVSFESV